MPSKSQHLPTTPADDAIRTRAYLMWEADGRPDGLSEHYWGLATASLTGDVTPGPKRAAAKAAAPASKSKAKPKVQKPAKDGPVAKGKKKGA